jgi:hypothetical protein
MNVEIGTEAPIFLFWEYLFLIFGILSLQCVQVYWQKGEKKLGRRCKILSYCLFLFSNIAIMAKFNSLMRASDCDFIQRINVISTRAGGEEFIQLHIYIYCVQLCFLLYAGGSSNNNTLTAVFVS